MAEPAPPPAAPATQTLYDKEGNAVEVPVGQTGVALAAGLGFDKSSGAPVFVADASGKVQELSVDKALEFFSGVSGIGGRGATAAEYQEQQDREAYGGALGTVGAGLAGAARGASLGLSDVAIAGLGGGETLQKLDKYNPGTSTSFEVLGALAPALASGGGTAAESGAALAARGAARVGAAEGRGALARGGLAALDAVAAPSRAAEAVGRAAETGLTRVLGGESLAARVVAGAAAPAVEGAVGGVVQEAARSVIDDSPLTADRLLAAGGTGALLGGATGGAFTLAGEVVAAGGRAAGRAIEGGTRAAVAGAEDLAGKGYRLAADVVGKGRELAQDAAGAGRTLAEGALEKAPGVLADWGRKGLAAADDLTRGARGALEEAAEGRAGPVLSHIETRKAVQATGAPQRKLDELAERGDAVVKRVADRLHDELPALAGKKSLANMSRADIAAAAKKGREASGAALGDWLDELDGVAAKLEQSAPRGAKAPNVRPNVRRIARDIERDVIGPIDKKVFGGAQAQRLREITADFAQKADGMTLREVHATRAELDDLIFENQIRGARPLEDAYRKMRGVIEAELERTADRVIKYGGLPESSYGKYKAAKRTYSDYVWLDEASNKGAWREAGNRTFGLSEQFGLLGGLAFAGAPGAIAGAVLQNLTRRYGDQVAATWARRAATLGAFEAATSLVDDIVGDSLRSFFGLPRVAGLIDAARPLVERGVRAARQAATAVASGAEGLERRAREGARSVAARARDGALRAGERAGAAVAGAGEAGARGARALGRGAARGVAEAFAPEPEPPPAERYRVLRAQVRAAQRTLPARRAAGETAPDVRAQNPALADRMTSKAEQIAANIAREMAAVDPPKGASSAWSGREPVPANWDAMGVLSYARGALEPLEVCLDLADGRVDHDAIRGLRENSPDLYADLQRQAVEMAAEHYGALSYEKRVVLGVLLDVPTDDTLEPKFVASIQSAYANASSPEPPGPPPGGPPPGPAPDLAGAYAPRSNQLQSEM